MAVILIVGLIVLRQPFAADACTAAGVNGNVTLDLAQTANAATIAAVGKRDGLPDHAVTVALAAALQESRLRNLPYGDLDSVGLFQQRPSQGWGSRSQLLTPSYAAAAFYRGLAKIPGWQTLAVTDAAQQVQRSAAPSAYAKWDHEARTEAEVLTGETAAGLTCHFATPAPTADAAALRPAMADELGTSSPGPGLTSAQGWTMANWLVAHAQTYRITSVGFAGQRWDPVSGRWAPSSSPPGQVAFAQG